MKNNTRIGIVGSFVKMIGDLNYQNYYKNATTTKEVECLINFYNPICTSTIMINKESLIKKNVLYQSSLPYSYGYYFIQDAILNNIEVANIPEVLLEYRCHSLQKSRNPKFIQNRKYAINDIQYGLLKRFFNDNDELVSTKRLLDGYPFEKYNKDNVKQALKILYEKNKELNIVDNKCLEDLIRTQFL